MLVYTLHVLYTAETLLFYILAITLPTHEAQGRRNAHSYDHGSAYTHWFKLYQDFTNH